LQLLASQTSTTSRPSRAQTRQLLLKDAAEGKWRAWVQDERGNATEAELAMARGPRLTCTMWNAMDYQAVTFLTQGGHPLANECLVLTWHTVHESSGQRVKYPYVGKVKSFLTNVPPWALGNHEERQSQAVKLVYAEWFDYVRNTNALGASSCQFSKRAPHQTPMAIFGMLTRLCQQVLGLPSTMAQSMPTSKTCCGS